MQSQVDCTRRLQYLALDLARSEISVEKETGLDGSGISTSYGSLIGAQAAANFGLTVQAFVVPGEQARQRITGCAFDKCRFAAQSSETFCSKRRPYLPAHSIRFRIKRGCYRSPLAHRSSAAAESRNRFPHDHFGKSRCKKNRGKLVPYSHFVYGRYPAASRDRERTRPGDSSGAEASRR